MKILVLIVIILIVGDHLCHGAPPKRPARAKRGPGKRKGGGPQRKGKVATKTSSSAATEDSEETAVAERSVKKMGILSKLIKSKKSKYLALGAVGAATGVRVFKRIKGKKGASRGSGEVKAAKVVSKATAIGKLSPAASFASYFGEEGKSPLLGDSASTTPVEDAEGWATEAGKAYTVLLFDVESQVSDATDKQARGDFFKLLGNLTGSAAEKNELQTLYIPGKSNKNLLEGEDASSVIGKAQWKYLSSKKGSRGPDVAAVLRSKYGVKPEELRIVVLGPDYKLISENALDCLRINPYGLPWKPSPLTALLNKGGYLEGSGGNATDAISLKDGYTAVYFSASWCQPCKKFTPTLVEAYAKAKSEKKEKFEMIYVSLDSEEEAFDSYRAGMPWPAVGFRDTRRALLQMGLGIKSIPALVVLDPQGRVLTSSGVTDIATNKTLHELFTSNQATDLGESVEILQRHPVCIALCDTTDKASTQALMSKVSSSATGPASVPRGPRESLVYCVLDKSSKMADAIRTLCGIKASDTGNLDVVVLDLVAEQYGHMVSGPADAAAIESFGASYKGYEMELKAINTELGGQ